MAGVVYRDLAVSDLPRSVDVYVTARADMNRRMGFAPGPAPDPAALAAEQRGYAHVMRTGIFRVAEVDGEIQAVCCAVVRDALWFLAGFWVMPAFQRQGLGGPLLRQVWQAGIDRGAATQFVWASSDTTAMAAYMKVGMLPGSQILKFAGAVTRLPEEPAGFEEEPLPLSVAVAIDEAVRATGREVDHLYWLGAPGNQGWLVHHGGRPAGYYYVEGATLGAVAWLDPAHGESVLAMALRRAAASGGEAVRLRTAGENHTAIRAALQAGLKLDGFSHFLTTGPVGRAAQYLPSGPLLY